MNEEQVEWVGFPEPHSKKQALIMDFFRIAPECKDLVVSCGSKFGKTQAASTAQSKAFLSQPRAFWRWLAPIYSQTKIGYDYCLRQLPKTKDIKGVDSIIKCFSLEAQIQFMHAQNSGALEGFATAGSVFDEAAKIKKSIYDANQTTRSRTRSKALYVSTPEGKNHFYTMFMEAKEEMRLAKRQMREPRMMAIAATTLDNPWIPRASIEDARRRLPDRLFRQYILAEFVDEANVFGRYRENFYGDRIDYPDDNQIWIDPNAKEIEVVIGADWAKLKDFTVFIAFDIKTKKMVGFQRFHKFDKYTEAIRNLVIFSKKFKEVREIYHDKTGVGVAIDDQLAYTNLPYKGITFTNAWKTTEITRLITSLEHKSIELLNWRVLDEELGCFEVEVNDIGVSSYSAPNGMHDDTVMALVLAHCALMQYSDLRNEIIFVEDLVDAINLGEPSSVEQYYQQILMDED